MTDLPRLKERIRDVLKGGYFADESDFVDVSDGDVDGDDLHVVVVSRKLDGRRMAETQDLILGELTRAMPWDEVSRVSLLVGVSPEKLKAL